MAILNTTELLLLTNQTKLTLTVTLTDHYTNPNGHSNCNILLTP